MDLIITVMVGIGVAMDASAVAMANGMVETRMTRPKALFIALTFSIFQGIMPIIGYYCGRLFTDFINDLAHYVSFALLFFLGSRMVYNALFKIEKQGNYIEREAIIVQGFATSIDAMLIGLTFALHKVTDIYKIALIIVIITFILTFISVYLGSLCGCLLKDKAELLGGIILLFIAFYLLF